MNPKNNDDNYFQYSLTVALNYQNIKKEPQRIPKINPFINQYDWKEMDFSSEQKDWKTLELNNKTIALNILFTPQNTEEITLSYKSKHSFKRENPVTLLMVTDGKKQHYCAVKSLPVLLRGITSNHDGDFHCLNCFHSYSTKNKLKKQETVCNDHDYCCVEIPIEGNKILKYNHGEKFQLLFMLTQSACLKKCARVKTFLKDLIQKKTKHTSSRYSLFTNCSFDLTMKTKIINCEKKRNDTTD